MTIAEFMNELYNKTLNITTDEEWSIIKKGIDIVTAFVVTDAETWESIQDVMTMVNELDSAQAFIELVQNADNNGYYELLAAMETWIWDPDIMSMIEYAVSAYPISVPEDGDEMDLTSAVGLSLVNVYNHYLPQAEAARAELASLTEEE